MDIISTMLVIALIGVVCWAIVTLIPMPDPFPRLIIGAAVVSVLFLLLSHFGVLSRHTPTMLP